MTARDDDLAARGLQNDEFGQMNPRLQDLAQSSSAFTDLGDNRKLRRLRFTLFR
jgi:hypothetical protein